MFGIIFVVLGHGASINKGMLLGSVFPYYSFHMALFAFVSGYFFKDIKCIEFLKKKTKKLIISYLLWNIIYGIIVNLPCNIGLINNNNNFTLYNIFISLFMSTSNQFKFNVAAWFLISIYFVQLIYFFINKINKKIHINTKYILLMVSIIIAVIEIEYVKKGLNYGIWYLITRICFLMPFYCMGQVYKGLEKYDKLNNIAYFIVLLIIQTLLMHKFKNLTYNLNLLSFKHNYIVYMLASITGIMFWLRVSSILEKYIGNNKIINYIGNNTYAIMMHHVFVFFIINTGIYYINKITGLFGKFDINAYKSTVWYVYDSSNASLMLLYTILGISVPLLVKYFYEKTINKYKDKREVKS